MRNVGPVENRNSTLIKPLHHDVAAGNWDERAVVCDALFLHRLGGGHLVVAVENLTLILDGEQRVGAPLRLVSGAAARLPSASPLIGEENLGAVIVKCRRVPEGHVGVPGHVDPERMGGIAN